MHKMVDNSQTQHNWLFVHTKKNIKGEEVSVVFCKQTENSNHEDQNEYEQGRQLYRNWVWIMCKTVKAASWNWSQNFLEGVLTNISQLAPITVSQPGGLSVEISSSKDGWRHISESPSIDSSEI